jgi:predicted nuclease of predicted toxin-antitoxin system
LKFLADENIFPNVITFLRKLGHEFKGIQEYDLTHATDENIIDIATKEKRTILTFDKHFGDILRYPPQNSAGIILIRIHPPLLDDIYYSLNNLFDKYHSRSFEGRLIILSKSGYRIR